MIMLLQTGTQAAPPNELIYVWSASTAAGKTIIILLGVLSIFVWSVMLQKAFQTRQARKLNKLFVDEFHQHEGVLVIHERNIHVEGCPLFNLYDNGCRDLLGRLKTYGNEGELGSEQYATLKTMEHVKRTIESDVAKESLKLEKGLILLAIAVSGAPFVGLLGTVWGVMSTFTNVAMLETASLQVMAPGVAAALGTTVAGLLVAIPSMVGYNWLVHNLRVFTVELDNFAQELASCMENEFLKDE
ncbi:MAG: MotA/TolQ/ExbB proton channel family protein [Verrucomicrobia bacterium]|nr:MotA/TolQ/ExbB proton channel family protein [Verrucomicrobiota bacterium]